MQPSSPQLRTAGRDGDRWRDHVAGLIAAFWSVLLVLGGCRLIAGGVAPVAFGQAYSSDISHPEWSKVVLGAVVACFGFALGWCLVRGRGRRSHQVVAGCVLLLIAAWLGIDSISSSARTRCVENTYTGEQACTSRAWAASRSIVLMSFPTAVAGLVLAIDPSPGRRDKAPPLTIEPPGR